MRIGNFLKFCFLLIAFENVSFSNDYNCLDFGWRGVFNSEGYCQLETVPSSTCTKDEVSCNPSVFGDKLCIKKSDSNSNLSCVNQAKKNGIEKTKDFITNSDEAYSEFDQVFQDIQVFCDVDFGDSRNQIYCTEMSEWLESVADSLNANRPEVDTGTQSLNNLIAIGNFIGEQTQEDNLGDKTYNELLEIQEILKESMDQNVEDPRISDSPRESALSLSTNDGTMVLLAKTNDLPTKTGPSIGLGPKRVALNVYKLNPTKMIPNQEQKKFYIDFKAEAEIQTPGQLQLNGYALGEEVVTRLRSKFIGNNQGDIVATLNSLNKEQWKSLLLGDQKETDLLRASGLLETRRGYEDLDEHLSIMMNEKFSDTDFEKEKFIATGFIEVENEKFISAKEIANGNVEIDPVSLRVNILKSVSLFVLNEIEFDDVDLDLTDLVTDGICSRDCIVSSQGLVGDAIEAISKMNVEEKSSNQSLYCLYKQYLEICESEFDLKKLEDLKKKLNLSPDCDI